MYAKVHEQTVMGRKRTVVAACDADLLGKVLGKGDGAVLDLKKYRWFYEGKRVTKQELQLILKGAENVNLVGEKTIKAAGEVLPLSLKDAKKIGGAPHVQFYRL